MDAPSDGKMLSPVPSTPPHLSKRFTGTLALDDVQLDLRAGEIHALLGENGAGKSTLIKILARVHAADRGEFFWNGARVSDLAVLPVSFVHQDLGLVETMSVSENVALVAGYARVCSLISWRSTRERASSLLALLGTSVLLDQMVSELSSATSPSSRSPGPFPTNRRSSCWTSRPPRCRKPTWLLSSAGLPAA